MTHTIPEWAMTLLQFPFHFCFLVFLPNSAFLPIKCFEFARNKFKHSLSLTIIITIKQCLFSLLIISAATIRVPVASRRLPSRAQAFCCLTWRLHWKSVSWGLKNHLGDSMVCKNCTQKSCKVLLRKSSNCRFEYLESWTLGDLGGLFFCQGYMTPLYPNTSITSNLSRACCAMTVVSCQAFSTKRRLVETSKPCRRIHTVCGFLPAPKLDGVYIMRCKYQIKLDLIWIR